MAPNHHPTEPKVDEMRDVLDQRVHDLLSGWDKACAVFEEGDHTTKVCALALMASLLPLLPPAMQDLCEGTMADFMEAMELSAAEMAMIRHFRGTVPPGA